MSELTASSVWDALLVEAPELAAGHATSGWSSWSPDDGLHILLGATLNPLLEQELDRPVATPLLERLMAFLERMAASPDDDVVNVLTTTVLAALGDEPERLSRARELMGPRTLRASEEVESFWGRNAT